MQSHRADSCNTTNSPQGRLVAFSRQGSPAQRPVSVCQCQCSPWNAVVPDRIPICVYIFAVYVYSTQLPAARRKARVCQLHDTTHGSSSSPRSWSWSSYSDHISRGIHSSYHRPPALVLSALTSCIHHRTGAGARRSANAMPAPQLYLCKLCHTCHTKRGLVL